jgi:hypothetical protein
MSRVSIDASADNAQPVFSRVTPGELRLGSGIVPIVGALLPRVSTEWDHTLGLEPYPGRVHGVHPGAEFVDAVR